MGCWLYGQIYQARNRFLHGNPVTRNDLMVKRSKRSLFQCAAPLYRMALTGFLAMTWEEPVPSVDDQDAFGAYVNRRMVFNRHQEVIEEGLLTAIDKNFSERITFRPRARKKPI